jgi:hypothetical protein
VEGVPVKFYGNDGVIKGDHVRLIGFDDPPCGPGCGNGTADYGRFFSAPSNM